jgi:adenylyl cyclase-associated protein
VISVVAPPPPPPPPPPPVVDAASSSGDLTGAAAVFAQINQGTDVTSRLKKVEKSEMTHKNPSLRVSGAVPARASSPSEPYLFTIGALKLTARHAGPKGTSPPKPRKPTSLQAKKPSKMELQGSKWVVVSHSRLISSSD